MVVDVAAFGDGSGVDVVEEVSEVVDEEDLVVDESSTAGTFFGKTFFLK